jgi:hypothetical protein
MTKIESQRFWLVALLWAATVGLPIVFGCSSAEEPKTQQQIEESRSKHQETSRREWAG